MKHLTVSTCLTLALLLGSAGVSFALPACPSDQSKYYDNCFGTYTQADGSEYVGEYKDDKRNGHGTFTFAGEKYVGGWKDDQYHGQGTYTFADGGQFVGEHKDGDPHGEGTRTYADGSQLVVKHKDGLMHGWGTHTYAYGRIEQCMYKNNVKVK